MNNINQFRKVGEDVFVGKYVDISRPHLVDVGSHVAIDSFFFCTTELLIGDYVHVAPHVSVIGGGFGTYLKLGDFSFVAAGSRIICGSEDYTAGGLMGATIPQEYRAPIKLSPVTFEPFAGCGTGCIIMPGVTLAMGSMIGAGSVVTKSTEPFAVYLGSPAKLVKLRTPEDIAKTLQYAKALGYEYKL